MTLKIRYSEQQLLKKLKVNRIKKLHAKNTAKSVRMFTNIYIILY